MSKGKGKRKSLVYVPEDILADITEAARKSGV